MKKTGIMLVAAAILSTGGTAQDYTASLYPNWFNKSIPGVEALMERQVSNDNPVLLKTVTLSTGVKLQYTEQGDPKGTPVILLHGFPDSWHSYEQVLPHLPKSLHVYALSQRGFGHSDKPARGYHPQDFAGDVAAFIKEFNLPPAIIVGHSMGSYVTMQFAVQFPELVRAIILEGTIASFSDKKEMVEFNRDVISQLQDPVDTALIREFQQSTLVNPVPKDYFNTLVQESIKVPAHVWKGVWEGLMAVDFRKSLRTIKRPTLLIWGDKDGMGPRSDQQLVLDAIEGSKLLVYESTGHSAHWERPERFAKDITQFITGITKAGN